MARYADASDYESLVAAFKDVSIVIVASTTTQYVKQVAQAAIDVGIDYFQRREMEKGRFQGCQQSISKVIEEFLGDAKSERLEKEMNTW